MRLIALFALSVFCVGCGSQNQTAPGKHYPLSGKVVSVNTKDQTALIDGAAIPGYMDAMTMDYPVRSKADLNSLHPGDKITATVDVSDDGVYSLSHIKAQGSGK